MHSLMAARDELSSYYPDIRTKDWYRDEQWRKDRFINEKADEERVIRVCQQVSELTTQVSRLVDTVDIMAKRITALQEQVELQRIEGGEFA